MVVRLLGKTVHRLTDGVKVVAGDPYMIEEAEDERWVYTPEGQAYYYNADTYDIRLRTES